MLGTSGWQRPRETLDDTTPADPIGLARLQHLAQFFAQCGEVGNLALDFDNLALNELIHILAWLVVVIGQRKQFTHLRHAKTQLSRASNEGERRQMVVRVVAIVAVCPVSGGENTLALVIAELWFDSEQGMEAVLTSDTYKTVVFPDEKTFLDHDNTLILVGEQVEIIGDHRAG